MSLLYFDALAPSSVPLTALATNNVVVAAVARIAVVGVVMKARTDGNVSPSCNVSSKQSDRRLKFILMSLDDVDVQIIDGNCNRL